MTAACSRTARLRAGQAASARTATAVGPAGRQLVGGAGIEDAGPPPDDGEASVVTRTS